MDQPARQLTPELAQQMTTGGYWLARPRPRAEIALVASGAVLPEAIEAHGQILEGVPEAGPLAVASVDRLYRGGIESSRLVSHVKRLLEPLSAGAGLITVLDAHPATVSWLAPVPRQRVSPSYRRGWILGLSVHTAEVMVSPVQARLDRCSNSCERLPEDGKHRHERRRNRYESRCRVASETGKEGGIYT